MGSTCTKHKTSRINDNICCICLDGVPDDLQSKEDYKKFKKNICCGCILHKSCLTYLKKSNTINKCPNCRGNFVTGGKENILDNLQSVNLPLPPSRQLTNQNKLNVIQNFENVLNEELEYNDDEEFQNFIINLKRIINESIANMNVDYEIIMVKEVFLLLIIDTIKIPVIFFQY